MHSYLREKMEGRIYVSLTQLQQFASVQENQIKKLKEPLGHHVMKCMQLNIAQIVRMMSLAKC
jgi:hypothetical protein